MPHATSRLPCGPPADTYDGRAASSTTIGNRSWNPLSVDVDPSAVHHRGTMAKPPEPLTAAAFFAKKLDGASPADAARACMLPPTTVYRIAGGKQRRPPPDKLVTLELWSRGVPSARKAGVYLSTLKTLGLAP